MEYRCRLKCFCRGMVWAEGAFQETYFTKVYLYTHRFKLSCRSELQVQAECLCGGMVCADLSFLTASSIRMYQQTHTFQLNVLQMDRCRFGRRSTGRVQPILSSIADCRLTGTLPFFVSQQTMISGKCRLPLCLLWFSACIMALREDYRNCL